MEKFSRSAIGYNIDEVNKFVDDMTKAYEDILDKLKENEEEIKRLKSEPDSSSESEEVIDAKNKADRIIADAKENASKIVDEALLEAAKTRIRANEIKTKINELKKRTKEDLQKEIDIIDKIDIDDDWK